ncbi:MAG: NUDIX hydrolase [Nitrospira sp.]|nr:NUDIX hydrolase [Nitrospira sp.]
MKVLSEQTLWSGKFLKTTMITYMDRNGVQRQWEAVRRVRCQGIVVVIPVTTSNEVIFIRQYRPALDNYIVEFPAGLIDEGESALQAAARELIEETGYVSDDLQFIKEGIMSTGLNFEEWKIVLARNAVPAGEDILASVKADENEDIEVILVPAEEVTAKLDELAGSGSVVDMRLAGLWDMVRGYS